MPTRRVAILYDFDRTLSPDDMQAFTFIPSLGMSAKDFFQESNRLAHESGMEKNLAWMKLMLDKAKEKQMPIHREAFEALGEGVALYPGVKDWFSRLNKMGEDLGLEVEHYIISSGLKEIIEGSAIAGAFKRIYASTYWYDANNNAAWAGQAVNYTNKTQYIFRIAKGFFEVTDDRVNDSTPASDLHVPYENFVYIGDSDTDIPCMRLVKDKGGVSIGVYDPKKRDAGKVAALYHQGRINYYAPADYRPHKRLDELMGMVLRLIAAREDLKSFKESL